MDIVNLPYDELKQRMIRAMRAHKGEKNAISPYNLFRKVYGVKPEAVAIEDAMFLKSRLNGAIASLKRTHYFHVVSVGWGQKAQIYIPTCKADVTAYKNHIESKKKRMDQSVKETEQFVKSKLYNKYGQVKLLE